jgi:exopolysaccharide biosynthesis polyprenyl glycosylphosphotransferase
LDHAANLLIKRAIDIVGGLVGLVLSIPIIAVCGILIFLESPGPIFYSQVRTGRNGRSFRIYKLRSMKLDAEKSGTGWSTKNDDRRLKIGSVLRNLNLDEVPQFWNVLKGDMSLVGPRPERPELIAQFRYDIPHYNARLATKPGITGWAQVNGLRGDTDLTERVRYDLYYLENWTPLLDFYIMFLTFIRRENAY